MRLAALAVSWIVVAAVWPESQAALNENPAPGDLDPRFGVDGVVVTPTAADSGADHQNGLAIQRDGKILVGGESDMGEPGGGFQWRMTRYTREGDIDVTFGAGGTVLTSMASVGGYDERMVSLAVQRDGKIVAAGSIQTSPDSDEDSSALARYHHDGTLDTAFGDGGIVVLDVAPGHDFVTQVLIDAEDRILVGGGCRHFFLARYRPDGTLDASFNPDGALPGLVITEVSPPGDDNTDEILGMAIDERGGIVAGGYSTVLERAIVQRELHACPLSAKRNARPVVQPAREPPRHRGDRGGAW